MRRRFLGGWQRICVREKECSERVHVSLCSRHEHRRTPVGQATVGIRTSCDQHRYDPRRARIRVKRRGALGIRRFYNVHPPSTAFSSLRGALMRRKREGQCNLRRLVLPP